MPFSAPDFEAFRAQSKSFEGLGAYGNHYYELSGVDSPQRIDGARVSASLLTTLGVDGPVLAFTLGLSILTALLFGIFPAFEASRANVNEGLREGARGQTQGRERGRVLNALVIAQFALALILLVGAGLLLRSFARLMTTNPGFRPDHVLTMTVSLPGNSYRSGAQVRDSSSGYSSGWNKRRA